MRRNVWLIQSLALAFSLISVMFSVAQDARDEPRPAKAKAAVPPPIDPDGKRMEQLLGLWAQQSVRLKSLDVRIKQVNKASDHWGDEVRFEGRALFKSPNLAWIDFQKVVEDDKSPKKLVPYERIICTGNQVWHYVNETKEIYISELDRKDRERALQEGPLPFLFNFRAEEAKQRYRMSLIREDKTSYVISVLPMEDVDRECFSKAFVRLDRKYLLPTQIVLLAPDEKSGMKSYELQDIKPNTTVMDANFKGQRLAKPWVIRVNEDTPTTSRTQRSGGLRSRRLQQGQPAVGSGTSSGRVR